MNEEDLIGKKVSATMNGDDWFQGVLLEIIDWFAPYRIELLDGRVRTFCQIREL